MIPRKLFSQEHEEFRASFRKFLEKEVIPHHEAWEERGYVDREVWQKAGENGFLCPSMPEQYGGSGADRLYSMVMMEETAKARTSGLGFSLHSEIVAPYLLKYGTEEQKAQLPAAHGARRDHRRHRDERARRRLRPAVGEDQRGQGRRGLLHRQRRQDLHHQRLECRPGDHRGQDQPGTGRQGHEPDPAGARHARLRARQAAEEAGAEGAGHLGAVLRQRQGARSQPARRRRARASST